MSFGLHFLDKTFANIILLRTIIVLDKISVLKLMKQVLRLYSNWTRLSSHSKNVLSFQPKSMFLKKILPSNYKTDFYKINTKRCRNVSSFIVCLVIILITHFHFLTRRKQMQIFTILFWLECIANCHKMYLQTKIYIKEKIRCK